MATRTLAQVAPSNGEIALNAYIFGYAGHSLVTPHAALKQLWWTDERIETKVTRAFVLSKLRGEERDFLDKPLAFGEGLTDNTYMEWILERARRLFLILSAIGVPDQIFGCIDDSWDDGDLPVPLGNIRALELSADNDDSLNKKFYDTQFMYLLRPLNHNAHIDYGPNEHIPMEHVTGLPPAVMLQAWDRVHFPNREDKVFMRRKFSLADKNTGKSHRDAFIKDVKKAQALNHEHVCPVWASYTADGSGFVLSDFVGEHTLGTFIDHRMPSQFAKVPSHERPARLCEWMHCLADALASIHHRGVAHSAIRPSSILIDKENRIAFADVGSIRTFQHGKKIKKNETYDYAAPESSISQSTPAFLAANPPASSFSPFNKWRKTSYISTSSSGSSGALSSAGSSRRGSVGSVGGTPVSSPPSSYGRTNSLTSMSTAIPPAAPTKFQSNNFRNFSRPTPLSGHDVDLQPPHPTSVVTTADLFPPPPPIDLLNMCDFPAATPAMSDIWSLACVYLDILTFMLKGKTTEFMKFRSTLVTIPAGGGGKAKRRTDTSFHADADKLDGWMEILREDCDKRLEPVFRGVPDLLGVVRRMLARNPHLRPSAVEVRDSIADILTGFCGMGDLCCDGREWSDDTEGARDEKSLLSSLSGSRTTTMTMNGIDEKNASLSADTTTPTMTNPMMTMTTSNDPASIATGMVFLPPPRLDSLPTRSLNSSHGDAYPRQRRGSGSSSASARLMPWRKAFVKSH